MRYDELIKYANNLISHASRGEVDLNSLRKVIARRGNIKSDESFTYFCPFVLTKNLECGAITKNTKDYLCTIKLTSLKDYEREKTEEGHILIYINASNSANCEDTLKLTDRFMLAFAFFYHETDDANESLRKTKEYIERLSFYDWYDEKEDFVEQLKTS